MSRSLALLALGIATTACITDDWHFTPLIDRDVTLTADGDVPSDPDADVPSAPDADVPSDADVPTALDADVPIDSDVPTTLDADVPATLDAEVPAAIDVPPPDAIPMGTTLRGAIAPSGAHVSATVRVRGTLSPGARVCNAADTVCVTGALSP